MVFRCQRRGPVVKDIKTLLDDPTGRIKFELTLEVDTPYEGLPRRPRTLISPIAYLPLHTNPIPIKKQKCQHVQELKKFVSETVMIFMTIFLLLKFSIYLTLLLKIFLTLLFFINLASLKEFCPCVVSFRSSTFFKYVSLVNTVFLGLFLFL